MLVLALLILASCNSSLTTHEPVNEATAEPLPARNPEIAPEPINLEVWLDLDFTRDNTLFEEMAEDFEEVYPEVDIEIFSFVRETIPQKVKLAVQSGIAPDVVQGHVYAMAGQNLAQPLDQQWAEWEATDPEAATQFLPSAMEEVTWQGQRYGVPLDIYTLVLIYNKEHFNEAGLEYPNGDYDLFYLREAAKTLTQPQKKRYGIGFTTDPWHVYAWVTGAGGDVLKGTPETGFDLTLDLQTNADALTFLTDMVEAGYGPLPTTRPRDYEETRERFLKGEISMYFGESQDIHLIQSTNPEFPLGVAQLPKTPARDSAASVLGSSGLFIPRGAQHRAVAFEFIKWATSDRYAVPMARRLGRYAPKTWLQTSPEFTENLTLIPFFNQLNAARPYRLDLFPEAEEAFGDAIKASFYNIAEPIAALQEAQAIAKTSRLRASP
jgi:ABC-type glycerol-3-phosphate transport system substrate-binding protein